MGTGRLAALALLTALAACATTTREAPDAQTMSGRGASRPQVETLRPAQDPPAVRPAAAAAAVPASEPRAPEPSAPPASPTPTPTPRPAANTAAPTVPKPLASPAAQSVAKPAAKPAPPPSARPAEARPPAPKPTAPKPATPKPTAAPAAKPRPAPEPVASTATAAATGRLAGRIEFVGAGGQRIDQGEVAEAVVYFLPKAGAPAPKPGRFTIDTHSKGFQPSLLIVPTGSSVAFPNRDEVLHNVFSATPGSAFDLGLYKPGETRSSRFTRPGLVIVNCNVHRTMRAYVLVLATPYYVRPGRDGRFVLDGLPRGPGTLVAWHPRGEARSQKVDTTSPLPLAERLVATRPRLGGHAH